MWKSAMGEQTDVLVQRHNEYLHKKCLRLLCRLSRPLLYSIERHKSDQLYVLTFNISRYSCSTAMV